MDSLSMQATKYLNTMVENKIVLTMMVPGATMLTQKACESSQNFDVQKVRVSYLSKGKMVNENLTVPCRASVPAKQVMQLSKEAYWGMISDNSYVYAKVQNKDWKHMGKTARLQASLKALADSFNAISFTYQVLDD